MITFISEVKNSQVIGRLKGRLRYLAPRNIARQTWIRRNVAVADCVSLHGYHYCAGSAHPLQRYASGLAQGTDLRELRRDFLDFFRYYRPVNAAQALGLPELDAALPMLIWPWKRALASEFRPRRAWCPSSAECCDVLTHFSDEGILSFRIEEEWMWSERARQSLEHYGYQPSRGVLRAHTLHANDGREAHLLMDGNHRAAALCAQGVERVSILSETRYQIYESEVDNWPNVVSGHYTRASALQIFHRYIEGNDRTATTDVPAPIIAPPGWLELYS